MAKKRLVKGTMLTALAALGMSLNLSSGEFEVTAYAADNPAVISADTYSREEKPGNDELSMKQYIASLATTADAGGWRIEDGVPYWYENGVKQGTEGRGKEIYDPGSDAWYWLDAVDGGRMAVSKDVYQESKADDEGNIGKWVRYDADGHMVKGWQTAEAGTYFFDYTYGTMAKGKVVMDGFKYTFDEATGILLSKEAHVHHSSSSVYAFDENGKYYTYTYCDGDLSTGEWNSHGACGSAPVWDGRSFVPQADTTILSKQTYPSWYDEHSEPLNVATGSQHDGSLEMYFTDGDWTGVSDGCWDFGYDNPVETIGVYAEGWVGHGWLSKNGLKK